MDVQLFSAGLYGKSKNVTAQERLNCYIEYQPDGDRSPMAIYGTPGLDLFADFGDTPARGLWEKRDYLYVVHRGTLWEVNNAGVKTAVGTLNTTSGRVYMADNGEQLLITEGTDGDDGYILTFNETAPQTIVSITNSGTTATLTTDQPHLIAPGEEVTITGATPAAYNGTFRVNVTGTTTFTYTMLSDPGGNASVVGSYTVSRFAQIVDDNYPGLVTVTWQDGYFIGQRANGQRVYISAINNGYVWDALDYSSAESSPDDIVSVATDNGNLHLFGENSTEMWANSGAVDFPFERISGASNEWGCAARQSVCKFDNSLAFLAKNKMGQVIVARMEGYLPKRISTPELETIINGYTSVSDAVAFSYMNDGHPFLEVNFPSAGRTWLYDGLSDCWSRLESHQITRHRANLAVNYLNSIVVSDFENGRIYRLNPESYTDNGDPIATEVITRHVNNGNDRMIVDMLQLNMESGVGTATGQGSQPQVMLQISKDGGHTYGNEVWRDFGAMGQYKMRAVWRRLGMARDWVFKFRITDPVKRVIFGATMLARNGRP